MADFRKLKAICQAKQTLTFWQQNHSLTKKKKKKKKLRIFGEIYISGSVRNKAVDASF